MTKWFCKIRRILTSLRRINRRGSCHVSCRFQRAVLAALRGADSVSCHFRVHFNVPYLRLCVVQNHSKEMAFVCLID